MYEHHRKTIEKAVEKLRRDPKVLAVLLGGSVAHGFAAESSDIDLMLLLSEDDYGEALKKGDLHYFDGDSADYPQGYVEGKYISESLYSGGCSKGQRACPFRL